MDLFESTRVLEGEQLLHTETNTSDPKVYKTLDEVSDPQDNRTQNIDEPSKISWLITTIAVMVLLRVNQTWNRRWKTGSPDSTLTGMTVFLLMCNFLSYMMAMLKTKDSTRLLNMATMWITLLCCLLSSSFVYRIFVSSFSTVPSAVSHELFTVSAFTAEEVFQVCGCQKHRLLSNNLPSTLSACSDALRSIAINSLGHQTGLSVVLCLYFMWSAKSYFSDSSKPPRGSSLGKVAFSLCLAVAYMSVWKLESLHTARLSSYLTNYQQKLPATASIGKCRSFHTTTWKQHCQLKSHPSSVQSQPVVASILLADSETYLSAECQHLWGTAYLKLFDELYVVEGSKLKSAWNSETTTDTRFDKQPSHLAETQPPQTTPGGRTSAVPAKPVVVPPKLPPLTIAETKEIEALSQESLSYLLLVFRDKLFQESSGAEPHTDQAGIDKNITVAGRVFDLDVRRFLNLSHSNDPLLRLLTTKDMYEIPKEAVEQISDAVGKSLKGTEESKSILEFDAEFVNKADVLGYYRIVVNARQSEPLIKKDETMAAEYIKQSGNTAWKTNLTYADKQVLSQIKSEGEFLDGINYGYYHGIHRNSEDGAIVFNCVGKYNNATQTCDGRISGSVRKCHFSDEKSDTKLCDTLIYIRDFGQGEGILRGPIFIGQILYPVPLSDVNTVKVNCTNKYDGNGCIGISKFEIDIDKFNGYGTCQKGFYLHYCLGGLNMYYGNLGLGDAASSDVDGYQILCEGVYNFKKRTCTKNYQKSSCVGDMLGGPKSFSCAGKFNQRKCDFLMVGTICGPKKTVCSKMLTDGKCLSFEPSTNEFCTGYTVTNSDKTVDCVGKFKVELEAEEGKPAKKIGECEGTMHIAKNQCDGKFVRVEKAICNGLMTVQDNCAGDYQDKLDNLKVSCVGRYLEKTDQCNGTQSLNFNTESTKICDGVSPLKTPDKCEGIISVSTRAKLYGANSFKGNLVVSRTDKNDNFNCKGVIIVYPHADQFFCAGDLRYTPDPTTTGKKFRCKIWDTDHCIPDNPSSKGVVTPRK